MTVWAQAGDRHGHGSPVEVACDAACRDPSPHYSGHPTPKLERNAGDCLACQSRAHVAATQPETPALGEAVVEPVQVVEPVAPTLRVVGIPISRGPPTV